MVEEPDAVRFLRLDDAGGEEQLLGDRPADLVGQRPRAVDPAVGRSEETECFTAWCSSSFSLRFIAFSLSGRFNVMMETPSSTSTRICS
jgi:hypothetical protein